MNNIKLFKIGGSIITNKGAEHEEPTVYYDNLKMILNEISHNQSSPVLVFGTGSFGHRKASELGLSPDHFIDSNSEIIQLSDQLMQYYLEILAFCENRGIRIHPFFNFTKDLQVFDIDSVVDVIRNQITPVFFGEIVFSGSKAKIISSHQLSALLASKLAASELCFYTANPGVILKDDSVVTEFGGDQIDYILENIKYLPSNDSSGGMLAKLKCLKKFGFKSRVTFRKI